MTTLMRTEGRCLRGTLSPHICRANTFELYHRAYLESLLSPDRGRVITVFKL